MSDWNKVALMIRAQAVGLSVMRVLAIIAATCGMVSGTLAADIPYVNEAIGAAKHGGSMEPAAIWALVAGVVFACVVALGWAVFRIGTVLQTQQAAIIAKLDAIMARKESSK